MEVSVCGTIRNFIGMDGSKTRRDWKGDVIPVGAKNNINSYRENSQLKGIYMYSDSVNKSDPAWGTAKVESNTLQLSVLFGNVDLKKIEMDGIGSVKMNNVVVNAGETKRIHFK